MMYRHNFNFSLAFLFVTFTALVFFPNIASAQQLQINSQTVSGGATASGDDAFATTEIDQFSHQDISGDLSDNQTQISVQQGQVNSTAIGNNTNAGGSLDQFNSQEQNDPYELEFGDRTQVSNQQGTINSNAIGDGTNAVNNSQQTNEQNISSF